MTLVLGIVIGVVVTALVCGVVFIVWANEIMRGW